MINKDGKTKVIVIRHGNTFNPGVEPRRVGGRTDLDLVPSGIDQAKKLGLHFRELQIQPAAIFSASLKRTLQTSQYVLNSMKVGLPVTLNPFFNEIDYGPDENQTETIVIERIGQKALDLWEEKGIPPSGWNVDPQQIISNWRSFLQQCVAKKFGQTVFIVTSNGIARFAPLICQSPMQKLATGSYGELCFDKNTWSLTSWNQRP